MIRVSQSENRRKMAAAENMNKYYKRLKRQGKVFLLNHRIAAVKYRVRKKDFQLKKEKYTDIINQIIEETEQFRNTKKPSLSVTEHPVQLENYESISMIGDSMGRVLRSDGRILRGIYADQVEAFKQIYDSGLLAVLAKHHMIPELRVTDYVTDEFALILEVQNVQIQKSKEWTYAMYKDACILVCLLGKILHNYGFTLVDGHLNNVTFDHGNPVFVDIGSIITGTSEGYKTELLFAGIYHLVFGFIGNSLMYRMVTHDDNNGNIFIFPRSYNLLAREYQMGAKVMKRHHLFHGSQIQKQIVHQMFDYHQYDPWDIDLLFPVLDEDKARDITWIEETADIICSLDGVDSLITAGGTCGDLEYSLLKKQRGIAVTASDFKEHRLDLAYLRLKDIREKCLIRLYNYLYLVPESVDSLKSDFAFFIDPLNDSPAFWPVNDNVLANAVCRLSHRWIGILYPAAEAERYQNLFETCFSPFVMSCDIRQIAQGKWCFALLKRKQDPDKGQK